MKNASKCLSLLFALILTVNCVCLCASAEDTQETFKPVLRFIASSDTHVRDDSDVTAQRIGMMLDLGYRIAENDPNYQSLDALLVAGDLTHDGTASEFEKFRDAVFGSLRDGTQFLGVVAKNHDGYHMPRAKMRETYSALTGNDADFHVVIGGYHFIGVSASQYDLTHYDPGQLKWLKAQLDAAVADDPHRPVFVMHHEHVLNTVFGSSLYDTWGVPYFTSILKQYPQIVDFSGHSHYFLNDPRSVWQGEFTAVGTGSIYYAECTIGVSRAYNPSDAYEVATCWIVEVDSANRIRLRGMDVLAGETLCEYILDNPADPDNRDYTPEKRKAASKAPEFASGATLCVREDGDKRILQIPAAQSTDGMPVALYRISVLNKRGMAVREDWALPKYYRAGEQPVIEYTVSGVPAGVYTVRVAAETAYGVQSAPLETEICVSSYVCPKCGSVHNGVLGFFTALFHRIVWAIAKVIG